MIHPAADDLIETLGSCQEMHSPEDEINGEMCSEEEAEKEDIEYRTKDVVRKYQFDYDQYMHGTKVS